MRPIWLLAGLGLVVVVGRRTVGDRRLQNLSAATGVPADVLAAFGEIESSNVDDAIRFECHRFNRHGWAMPCTTTADRPWSVTASETDAGAFYRAAPLDLDHAVRSSSWGRYQVMGSTALSHTGWSAAQFLDAFERSPADVSDEIAIGWWAGNPAARAAARSRDLLALARAYNGSWSETQAAHYADRLGRALA